MEPLPRILEALLFASPDGLKPNDAARVIREAAQSEMEAGNEIYAAYVNVGEAGIRAAMAGLMRHYETNGRAFTVVERKDGWRLCVQPTLSNWVRGLFPAKKTPRLSPTALETLAVVAFRQPATKAVIEEVRGVSVDGPMQILLDRGLVRVVGRSELPGRPMLYETTDAFLNHFGLTSVNDLPHSEELLRREGV